MLQLYILLVVFVNSITCRNSPNGPDFIAYLPPEVKQNISQDILDDIILDAPGIIERYKYPSESYNVQTEDGYILEVFNIPKKNGTPVLLMHGLMGSAADWIMQTPNTSLPYILHDMGFDVWLGNARGNYYSRRHVSLDPDQAPFWKFDWHEIGYYDLPAMIDFALKKNGKSKLHIIGHSQGNTASFVMLSTRPEYNKKIICLNSLAPAAYFFNPKLYIFKILSKYIGTVNRVYLSLSTGELSPRFDIRRKLFAQLCNENSSLLTTCMKMMYDDNGFNFTDVSRVPIYLAHTPTGASIQQITHYSQVYNSGKFQYYDHGLDENFKLYKSRTPPLYNLTHIVAPVAIHYSSNDDLIDENAINRLHAELGNSIGIYLVPRKSFTHLDFILGMDCKEQVYDRVLDIIKTYETNII